MLLIVFAAGVACGRLARLLPSLPPVYPPVSCSRKEEQWCKCFTRKGFVRVNIGNDKAGRMKEIPSTFVLRPSSFLGGGLNFLLQSPNHRVYCTSVSFDGFSSISIASGFDGEPLVNPWLRYSLSVAPLVAARIPCTRSNESSYPQSSYLLPLSPCSRLPTPYSSSLSSPRSPTPNTETHPRTTIAKP